uniref:G-protein coupled receptors family 1 profile domain-containing protein n=1 Tax=Sus scrofa TaxID=9823 RepID=A0A8D2C0N0_PIG
MRREKQSSVSEFLLLVLPIWPEPQSMFFALFLGMYLTLVLGNLLIIMLVRLDPHLQTPMYFFLSHLALTDVSLSSITIPKLLMNMQTQHQSMSYAWCISQMSFFSLFICLDNFLLKVMAYDRYVTICQPLHYTTVMRQDLCVSLGAGSCFSVVSPSWCKTPSVLTIILNFFCELTALLKLSCSYTCLNLLAIFTVAGMLFILSLSSIMGWIFTQGPQF